MIQDLLNKAQQKLSEGQFESARNIALEILELPIENENTKAEIFLLIGNSYFNNNQYHNALQYYQRAESILLKQKNDEKLLPCFVNNAIIFNNLEQFDLSISCYKKAFKYIGKASFLQKAQLHNGLGNVYSKQKKYSEALTHFKKVLKYSTIESSLFGIAMAWRNIASCQIDLGKNEIAISAAKKSIRIAAKENFVALKIGAIQSLAEAQYNLHKFSDSLKLLLESLAEAFTLNEMYNLRYHYLLIYKNYKALNNDAEALIFLEKWSDLNTKMLSTENTKLINSLYLQFETEKKDNAIKELEIQNKDIEIKELKSKMNPHFIFNAMASIQNFALKNSKEETNRIIGDFAHLMREVLDQSSNSLIPVSEEINFIKNYVQFESLQFNHSFSFKLICDNDVLGFEIPSFLLQPIIENSIKHGLFNKEGKKVLALSFKFIDDNSYKVSIKDNGIGREKSAQLNENRLNHNSFATQSIAKRIQLMQETLSLKIDYKVKDLKDFYGNAKGTETIIKFVFKN